MKKLIIILIMTISAVVPCLLCACQKQDQKPKEVMNADTFYCEWMRYIVDEARLVDVVIPGTHDSGTYNIGNGNDGFNQLSETQNGSFKAQLEAGARYFDIRVNYGGVYDRNFHLLQDNVLKLFHGLINYGMTFLDACIEINSFLERYPSEFIILDFQNIDSAAVMEALEVFQQNIPVHTVALRNNTDLELLTMSDLRTTGKRFIVLWNAQIPEDNTYLYRRHEAEISYYDQKYHYYGPDFLIDAGFPAQYAQRRNDRLFVLQAVLTNPFPYIQDGFYVYESIKKMEEDLNAKLNPYIRDLKDNPEYLAKTNIVMRDYLNKDREKTASALSLNLAKNLVRTEAKEFFAQMTAKPNI